jgi:2-polyprenyl-3-methyl-5-hydroxy-6-metoxy-1,4-benzoquinol methylase
MPDFTQRSSGDEIMDDLECSGEDLHQALRELESINYLLGGNYVTLNGLAQLLEKKERSNEFHIVDLGSGSGDMLKWMRKWLDKKKIKASLTGVDANQNVVRYAREHTPDACRIQYESINIFSEEFRTRNFDIVTGTLFFHHFTSDQLIGFFRHLKDQTSVGWIINDIHRNSLAYYSIKWLTQIFSKSQMVKHDAPQSVLRAFKRSELTDIMYRAGIDHFKIRWRWAFRWQLIVRFSDN